MYVVTHRSGLLSFLGHEHAIVVPDWTGGVCATDSVAPAFGYVSANSRTLEIDTDSARRLAGLKGGPSSRQLRQIRRKFQDSRHLASEQYPLITLDSIVMRDQAAGRWVADGLLTIRDQTRPVEIAFRVLEWNSAHLELSGTLHVKQSDFGIEPESIAGVVRVKDEVDIHFDLVARAGPDPCPASPRRPATVGGSGAGR
jgi:polyisoprenoid-binding protein YceI